jgi:hypothetical protein
METGYSYCQCKSEFDIIDLDFVSVFHKTDARVPGKYNIQYCSILRIQYIVVQYTENTAYSCPAY